MYQLEVADKIIKNLARKFYPSFRGYKDFEDLVQDAHIEAIKLDRKGALEDGWEAILTTWIKSLWLNELDSLKAQKRDRRKEVRIDDENFNPDRISFNPRGRMEAWAFLSDEAKVLASLFLDTPKELVELVQLHNNLSGIKIFLKKNLGWNEGQLLEWQEVWEDYRYSLKRSKIL